jgi:hypothetical protein
MQLVYRLAVGIGQVALVGAIVAAPIVFGFWAEKEEERPRVADLGEKSVIRTATMTTDFDLCYEGRAVLADGTPIVVHSFEYFPRSLSGRRVTVAFSRFDECWELQSPEVPRPQRWMRGPWERGRFPGDEVSDRRPLGPPRWRTMGGTPPRQRPVVEQPADSGSEPQLEL